MGLGYPRSDAVVPLMTTPETRGGRRIAQRKRCLRCHERGVANANKLCEDCKAAGWRWCSVGHHIVGVAAMLSVKHGCRACDSARQITQRYGAALTPPDGALTVAAAAQRLHYSANSIRRQARTGQLQSWRRSPTGQIWIVLDKGELCDDHSTL